MQRRHYKKLLGAMALAAPSLATSGTPPLEYYNAGNDSNRPFTLAVRAGDYVHVSGQMGTDANGLVPGGFEAQSRKALDNIAAILKGMNLSMDAVVKCTVMMADMNKWSDFNKVYATYFKPGRLPARSAFGVSALALGGEVEVECLAYAPVPESEKRRAR
jgi:2-iminobutanoate/2-iminopropanoate deaminase